MYPLPSLSIIICTYNRAELLRKCLDSIVEQSFRTFTYEVIVVDSSPNDDTRILVKEYSNRLPSLRYIFEEKEGHSVARNRGYSEAGGDYLIYLDDDATLPVNYIENVVQVITEHSPDIFGGPVYPIYISPRPWWFTDALAIRKSEKQSGLSRYGGISGGNFIIRKSLLKNLGLFDPDYGFKGGKLGMLDERKVLETYRYQTAPEQQKVYYSLECYINHHTPPDKMRFVYMLRRYFVAGEAQFWMNLDITGYPNHSTAREFIKRGIFNILYETPRLAIKRYFRHQDYQIVIDYFIDGIMRTARGTGYLKAQLQYLITKPRRTVRTG